MPDSFHGNGYSPLWHMSLPESAGLATRIAGVWVANSVGTFGLSAAPELPWCSGAATTPCDTAAGMLDHLQAVVLTGTHSDSDLDRIAATIDREAHAWP
jgi:hypothetical protein